MDLRVTGCTTCIKGDSEDNELFSTGSTENLLKQATLFLAALFEVTLGPSLPTLLYGIDVEFFCAEQEDFLFTNVESLPLLGLLAVDAKDWSL